MMASAGQVTEIGIVLYPGVQRAAVHGLTDLFDIANRYAATTQNRSRLRVTHWSLAEVSDVRLSRVYPSDAQTSQNPAVLILPPTLVDLPDRKICEIISGWLFEQHANGILLVSVCSGIFLIAQAGLLRGRTVSTHRICAQILSDTYPTITVDTDRRMIDHADILTAGGVMAWVDVGLLLVERMLGRAVSTKTARLVLSDEATSGSPCPSGFVPPTAHRDLAVRKAQAFIHVRDGQGMTLASLADVAGLERRTLIRRFIGATGMTPMKYSRAVRLARARELLEAGNLPLKKIAESLGYADTRSFARAFQRDSGCTPGAFRKSRADKGCNGWPGDADGT